MKKQRLQFLKEESENTAQKPLQDHMTKESNPPKPKSRLCFENTNEKIPKGKLQYHPKHRTTLVIEPVERQVREEIDTDNVGVEAASTAIESGNVLWQVTSPSRTTHHQEYFMKRFHVQDEKSNVHARNNVQGEKSDVHARSNVQGEKSDVHARNNVQGEKFNVHARSNVQGEKSNVHANYRSYQKRKIKRHYALERYAKDQSKLGYDGLRVETIKRSVNQRIKNLEMMTRNPKLLGVMVVLLVVICITSAFFSSCSLLFHGGLFGIVSTSYTSENEELIETNNRYLALEEELQRQIDEIENTYPNYDEYKYEMDAISHEPYELLSYLTAKLQYFYADEVEDELEEILQHQYELSMEEVMEIRYYIDETTGEEISYEYYVLNITLENHTIDEVARELLTAEELERYEIYLLTKGNKPFLFSDTTMNTGSLVDLSEVVFIDGERVGDANIAAIALSQVGNVGGEAYWSWYGFDGSVEWCACFVSWVLNQSGYEEPKFAACQSQGVTYFVNHGIWVDATNSSVATGDVIFFDWDYDDSADHVGVVIGSDGDFIYTVEGNSGDACVVRSYAVDSNVIMGYGLIE